MLTPRSVRSYAWVTWSLLRSVTVSSGQRGRGRLQVTPKQGGGCAKGRAEVGATDAAGTPWARQLPKARGSQGGAFSRPGWTPSLQTSVLQNGKEMCSCCFKPPNATQKCGYMDIQPRARDRLRVLKPRPRPESPGPPWAPGKRPKIPQRPAGNRGAGTSPKLAVSFNPRQSCSTPPSSPAGKHILFIERRDCPP